MAAETIGVVSGISALITTTLQGGLILEKAIKSYDGHPKIVRDFLDELVAWMQMLSKLKETTKAIRDVDFSMLEIPLRQCNNICEALHKELQKCLSRSNDSHTSFRDWIRLKYMGEDIDGIRRLLAEYKMTISIALADANLHESSITTEKINNCNDLLNTTKADLQGRLETIDDKIERIIDRMKESSEESVAELRLVEEERLSTERCLQVCAKLSDHINQLQLTFKRSAGPNRSTSSDIIPQKMMDEGFEGCVSSLSCVTSRLEEHQKQLFDQLINKIKATSFSDRDRMEFAQLRDEWIAARHNLDIWSSTQSHLREKISVIENYATGIAVQVMASTGETAIHGRNHGLGPRTGQVGGHMNDDTIQQSLRVMTGIFGTTTEQNGSSPRREATEGPADGPVGRPSSSFKGRGFQLASDSPAYSYTTSRTAGEDECMASASKQTV